MVELVQKHLNLKHSGNLGDVLFSWPSVISLCQQHQCQANFYLHPGVEAHYYKGCIHPAGNVRMTPTMVDAIIPLLAVQPIIHEVGVYHNQEIDVDLDLMRLLHIDNSMGYIARYYFWTFKAHYDLSQPWLFNVQSKPLAEVVINRTQRYHNPHFKYPFLAKYKPLFIGLPQEYEEFRKECECEYRPTRNLLEVAEIIAGSKLFISNQSVAFAIAEALKVRRVLEVCLHANNVIPEGPGAYDAANQLGFEATVSALLNPSP